MIPTEIQQDGIYEAPDKLQRFRVIKLDKFMVEFLTTSQAADGRYFGGAATARRSIEDFAEMVARRVA